MTPEQKIIEILVNRLEYWAKPGLYPPQSEQWYEAQRAQDAVTLVTSNKKVYPYND